MNQAVLHYLPGYMFDGYRVVSTGATVPPTQFIDQKTGELMYYVRPAFDSGISIGMFIRHAGVVESIRKTKGED